MVAILKNILRLLLQDTTSVRRGRLTRADATLAHERFRTVSYGFSIPTL